MLLAVGVTIARRVEVVVACLPNTARLAALFADAVRDQLESINERNDIGGSPAAGIVPTGIGMQACEFLLDLDEPEVGREIELVDPFGQGADEIGPSWFTGHLAGKALGIETADLSPPLRLKWEKRSRKRIDAAGINSRRSGNRLDNEAPVAAIGDATAGRPAFDRWVGVVDAGLSPAAIIIDGHNPERGLKRSDDLFVHAPEERVRRLADECGTAEGGCIGIHASPRRALCRSGPDVYAIIRL